MLRESVGNSKVPNVVILGVSSIRISTVAFCCELLKIKGGLW